MPLKVSFDGIANLLAQQVYGNRNVDEVEMATVALQLAVKEVAAKTHLISQEAETTLTTTGAVTYTLDDVDENFISLVSASSPNGEIRVVRKPLFLARHPDYASWPSGITRYAVLWGSDDLFLWPDQSDQTIRLLYYKVLEDADASEVLWALRDIAIRHIETDPNLRLAETGLANRAIADLNKTQTRAQDAPITIRPEERVSEVNWYKRMRGK